MDLIFKLDEIDEVAKQFLTAAGSNWVFAFYGEMGAGKTTFIHALCNVMEVTDPVSSPTFSIINQYVTNKGATVYHMDLYRLNGEQEAINAGVEDCLYSGNVCLVEWPEKAPAVFPANTLHVTISSAGTDIRKISLLDAPEKK
jgi:tRNA threonylcarbamoyladenosine biosynthesis protein TsaE